MEKIYRLRVYRTVTGEAIVKANSPEEAEEKFLHGKEEEFADFSEDYPVEWKVSDIEKEEE